MALSNTLTTALQGLPHMYMYVCPIYVCTKVCLKSNGTGVTNYLFPFQTANYIVSPPPTRLFPSSLMHFPIFFYHASMHCWKDSSGTFFSCVITVLLMFLLNLGKGTWSKICWIGRLLLYGNIPLSQELPDTQGNVSRCIVVGKQPWFVLSRLSSLLVY